MLAQQTGDTSFLFIRSGNDAVCISREQGTYPIQTPSVPIGSRQPLGVSAGGLALLSALRQQEVEEIIEAIAPRLGAYRDLEAEELHELVAHTQKLGYALIGNHAVPGVRAIGLPIISQTGAPIAAVTVAAIHSRMTKERAASLLPLLKDAAQEVTRLLHQ
jgi:DNA-binding IclR family transcriptional regulator